MEASKPKLFTMKVNETELRRWQKFAKSKGKPLSDIIKMIMRGQELPADAPIKKTPKRKYTTVDPNLLFEINAIGNNLNQIARRVNQGDKFDVLLLLVAIEKKLERLLNAHQAP
ncbi:MobC family plasmid mobilization relaxosome protein [Sulfuricurvum sp.]|uniref:MobC family plasmid mobilization relaxosome protein n=1 Tax=Sulfuricurvum sp. TaxID=2025608 RepID=UPI0019CB5224|nr:MobC family plasmid mobilization relaxosome protein [Sulfuricurvum sp.]MBD3806839.1 MobC family plasmid mobilization relaxosome protein [Sulfuricurvum sp.]